MKFIDTYGETVKLSERHFESELGIKERMGKKKEEREEEGQKLKFYALNSAASEARSKRSSAVT
jgi:hypothetical protein